MNGFRVHALGLLVVVALTLGACASQTPTEAPAPATPDASSAQSVVPTASPPKVVTLKLGFTASQTGKLMVESTRQTNGLYLWMNEVNAAGGVRVGDNTLVKFEAVYYDDESTKERVQELYTRLAVEDNVDFMLSPYSSGLADASAAIAEQYGKLMITIGAASDSTYKQGYRLVYQTYTPASRYLTGAVDNIAVLDPALKKIAFVHEKDSFSTGVATAAKEYAESLGYEIVLFEGYESGTTDFSPFISRLRAANPEAIMGGGHFQDGSEFARQLSEKNIHAKYIALLVAPPEPSFGELGEAALGIVGPSQWEALAGFTPDSAAAAGLEYYGPLGTDFDQNYKTLYGEDPSYHAAGGYAAGLILQWALESAGSTNTQAVKAALDTIDILTFFGRTNFDTTAEAHGLQLGHSMVYIQWQTDEQNFIVKQVIWPPEGATAEALYPAR